MFLRMTKRDSVWQQIFVRYKTFCKRIVDKINQSFFGFVVAFVLLWLSATLSYNAKGTNHHHHHQNNNKSSSDNYHC
jgi:hypothetical protein